MNNTNCSVCKKSASVSVGCDICNEYYYCSRKCSRNNDLKEHKKQCLRAQKERSAAAQLAPPDDDDDLFELYFEVGDKVVCQTGNHWSSWQPGMVTEVRDVAYRQSGYLCKLVNGNTLFVRLVESLKIRPLDYNLGSPLELLIHHMRHAESTEDLIVVDQIISHHSLDFAIVGPKLLFATAVYGLNEAFEWLFVARKIDPESVDERGCNVLQLAITHKQHEFIYFLHDFDSRQMLPMRLISVKNKSGMNILHSVVMANDEQWLELFVTMDSNFSRSIVRHHTVMDSIDPDTQQSVRTRAHITDWVDSKGRTARDYAVLFKRPQFVTALEAMAVHYRINQLELVGSRGSSFDDNTYTQAFVELSSYLTDKNISLPFTLTLSSLTKLHRLAYSFAERAMFDSGLRWLVETFDLSLSTVLNTLSAEGDWSHEGCEVDLPTQLLKGSNKQYFSYPDIGHYSSKYRKPKVSLEELSLKMRVALYHLLGEWDGKEDLVKYIIDRRLPPTDNDAGRHGLPRNYRFKYKPLPEYHSWDLPSLMLQRDGTDFLPHAYIEQYLYRLQDEEVEARIAMMSWMVTERGLPLPPLHLFVEWGQFRLLRWACDLELVDLNAPLSSHVALTEHARRLDWVSPADLGRLTVGEFLCALAASLDELQIFQWLFAERVVDKEFRVGSEGSNMLHLAASRNNFLVVKWLVENSLLDPKQTTILDGMNAAHIAFQHSFPVVGMYLKEHVDASVQDGHGVDLFGYALASNREQRDKRLYEWAAEHYRREIYSKQLLLLQADPICDFSEWKEALDAYQFWDFIFYQLELCFFFHNRVDMEWPGKLDVVSVALFSYLHSLSFNNFACSDTKLMLWCFISLALSQDRVDFFECLKAHFEVLLAEESGTEPCLSAMLAQLITFGNSIAEQCPRALLFVTEWWALFDHNSRIAAESKVLMDQFETLLLRGAPVSDLEQSIAAQRQLSAQSHSFREDVPRPYEDMNFYMPYRMRGFDDQCPVVLHIMLAEDHVHIVEWLFSLELYDVKALSEALKFVALEIGSVDMAKLVLTELERCERVANEECLTIVCEDAKRVHTVAQFRDRAVQRAIIASLGKRCRRDVTRYRGHFELFKYLVDVAVLRGIDLSDRVLYNSRDPSVRMRGKCILRRALEVLLYSNNPTQWSILRHILSRPDLFDIHDRSVVPETGESSDEPVVMNMINLYFQQYHWLGDVEDQSVENMMSIAAGYTSHLIAIITMLCEHGMAICEHEERIVREASHFTLDATTVSCYAQVLLLTHLMDQYGFVIQRIQLQNKEAKDYPSAAMLQELKTRQAARRLVADGIASQMSNITLVKMISEGNAAHHYTGTRYSKGRTLLHIAALHNRVDVMQWLVLDYRMDLHAVDSLGDSVLTLSKKAASADCERFIRRTFAARLISRAAYSSFNRRRFAKLLRQCKSAVVRIQSAYRRLRVYRQFSPFLRAKRGSWEAFRGIWGPVMTLLEDISRGPLMSASWSDEKARFDMLAVEDSITADDTIQQSLDTALSAQSVEKTPANDDNDRYERETEVSQPITTTIKGLDSVDLSQSVIRWLQEADGLYKELFAKKMERLAEGDRSYALSKRLKGCAYPLFETKLDSGQRILWTQLQRGGKLSILVWFVSKHDDVGKHVSHIDKSYARLTHQPSVVHSGDGSVSVQSATLDLSETDTLLDPAGNCPLKIYTATRGDIPLLTTAGWTPPLRLGARQQEVQDISGTVLLLGRSGTGKTVCLSDRMTRDRDVMRVTGGVVASQLFVSRSKRLCEFVKSYQSLHTADKSELESVDFMTLERFVSHMETVVTSELKLEASHWPAARRVDFQRFKSLMTSAIDKSGLDAVVVWTQIRSFLKGSIEAVMQRTPLGLDQYLDVSVFGLERCRLLPDQRKRAFMVCNQYTDTLTAEGLWDDADRVLSVLIRSKLQPLSACNSKGADYHKVYVDEVQDNTQAEIVLYFLAAGMNTQSLFLAGDPAQSVVEGVDFRFEDVRSIVFTLSAGRENIQRPLKLFVNYRSHSGILNCAAAILDKMFAMFPGSAKVLPRDAGLFKGPRPAFCNSSFGTSNLISLLAQNQRLIVICPDERVADVERTVAASGLVNTVLGIRAAKGLEFQDIVMFDFFGGIPAADHKAWRSLLTDDQTSIKPYSHPQIESQLKLLYTAITRSCNRLIFVESEDSALCSSFFRWLRSRELAEPFVSATDGGTVFMTSDEWRVRGIDFALSAEGESTVSFLQKAVDCFTLAGDSMLRGKAQTQLDLEMLRRRLLELPSETVHLGPREELDAAGLVLRGLRTGLLLDTRSLCEGLAGRVAETKYFAVHVSGSMVKEGSL